MLLCLMPATAGAAEDRSAITLGTAAIPGYDSNTGSYHYIYFGNWNGKPVQWRVLDSKTNTGADGLFLLSEEALFKTGGKKIYFNGNHDGSESNKWQTSSARYWCVKEFTAFTDVEYSAILETNKSDPAYNRYEADENILNGDKVFFLSLEESWNGTYGLASASNRIARYNGAATTWWLRSKSLSSLGDKYAMVAGDDGWDANGAIDSGFSARPAMNLTGEQVLFSSPAVGGKTANGLTATGQYSGSELKLTVADNARSAFTAFADARYGNVVRFCYDSAATGSGEYLSAMVVNSGSVTYYGHIKNLSSSDLSGGTALLTLPDGFDPAKGDKLYVFNEQCNGDYQTDYASPLRELTGTGSGANLLQVKIGADNFWYVSNDGGATWTSLGVKATGADGKDGVDGKDGANGVDGIDGKDGLTPYIGENGNWWIGETDTGVAVTTKGDKGDPGAAGKDGIGIAKTEVNKNGELIITYTDNAIANLGKVTGMAGRDGSDGVSIANAEINGSGELVLLYSDGRKVVLGKVVGQDGKDGVGIQKAEINEKGELVLTYTDGKEAVLGKVTAEADPTLTIIALCLGGAALLSNIILVIYIVSRRKRVPV